MTESDQKKHDLKAQIAVLDKEISDLMGTRSTHRPLKLDPAKTQERLAAATAEKRALEAQYQEIERVIRRQSQAREEAERRNWSDSFPGGHAKQ